MKSRLEPASLRMHQVDPGAVQERGEQRTDLHYVCWLQQEFDSRVVLYTRGALGPDHRYGELLHLFHSQ